MDPQHDLNRSGAAAHQIEPQVGGNKRAKFRAQIGCFVDKIAVVPEEAKTCKCVGVAGKPNEGRGISFNFDAEQFATGIDCLPSVCRELSVIKNVSCVSQKQRSTRDTVVEV